MNRHKCVLFNGENQIYFSCRKPTSPVDMKQN